MMASPTQTGDRVEVIDVLRGVALLGILPMNITLGQPGAARLNPLIAGGFSGLNFWTWVAGFALFDEKMITLFSMLFGAGVILFSTRLEQRGLASAPVFYRRSAILLLIGLVHAYGLWEGDILFTYAVCGMLIYPLRHMSARTLLLCGAVLWLVSVPFTIGFAEVLRDARQSQSELWTGFATGFGPDKAEVAAQIERVRHANYLKMAADRAPEAFAVQTRLLLVSLLWTVSGRMLLGMALLKSGFLTGSRERSVYRKAALLGYGLGFPAVAASCTGLIRHGFDPVYLFRTAFPLNSAGSIFVAIGHASMLILVYQSEWARGMMRRLEAVGRMALTNYLAQTLITTTLFYGYGFAQFGAFSRVQLYGLVLAVWAWQLWYSPLWLSRFRFGPVEWIWRLLTYGKAQRQVSSAAGG